jgi:O-antigen/teichoic acid export membrane protein
MSYSRSAVYSIAVNVSAVSLAAIFGLVATSAMARNLPPAEFGRVMILIAALNAVAIFEGLRPVVIYEVSKENFDLSELRKSARRILLTIAGALIVMLVLASVAFPALQLTAIDITLIAITVIAFFIAVLEWAFLDGFGDTAYTGAIRGGAWALAYAFLALASNLTREFTWYVCVLAAMNVGLAIIYHLRLRGRVPEIDAVRPPPETRSLLGRMMQNVATNVSSVVINTSDRLIIGAVMGAAWAGRYSGQNELATKPSAFARAMAQVLLPVMARLGSEPERMARLWYGVTSGLLALALVTVVPAIALRKEIVALILGGEFARYADVFGMLAMTIPITVLGYLAVVCLNATGDFHSQKRWYAVGAVIMLAGTLVAAKYGGILEVAKVYVLVRGVDAVLVTVVVRRLEPIRARVRFVVGCLLCLVVYLSAWLGFSWIGLLVLFLWVWWIRDVIASAWQMLRQA